MRTRRGCLKWRQRGGVWSRPRPSAVKNDASKRSSYPAPPDLACVDRVDI
jgi:hypothetical protein